MGYTRTAISPLPVFFWGWGYLIMRGFLQPSRRIWIGVGGLVFACLAVSAVWLGYRRIPRNVFPAESWTWISPASAGYSAERLALFSDYLGGEGCIVYRGRMLHAWGDIERRNDIASAAKPLYTHFTLKAVEEGRIESLDEPVLEWAPELMPLNEVLQFKDRHITFRHLLMQTSGYGLHEPPGTAFAYNDLQTGLLVWILLRRVYGCGYFSADQELLDERLGRWIGFEDHPTLSHPSSLPGRVQISTRDMARFGHLYLMRGRWRRVPVLRSDLVRLAVSGGLQTSFPRTSGKEAETLPSVRSIGGGRDQEEHAGSLNYFWWTNPMMSDNRRLLPNATPETFLTIGHRGRFVLAILPEHHLVISWQNAFAGQSLSPFDSREIRHVNRALGLLRQARTRP